MFFYIISNGKYCKIGITENIKNRLNTLQTGSSEKLTEVEKWYFKNRVTVEFIEDEAEKYLLPYKIRGEWYRLDSKEIIQIINHILKTDSKNINSLDKEGINISKTKKLKDFNKDKILFEETDDYWIKRKKLTFDEKKILWDKHGLGSPPDHYDDWFVVGGLFNEEPILYLPVKLYE